MHLILPLLFVPLFVFSNYHVYSYNYVGKMTAERDICIYIYSKCTRELANDLRKWNQRKIGEKQFANLFAFFLTSPVSFWTKSTHLTPQQFVNFLNNFKLTERNCKEFPAASGFFCLFCIYSGKSLLAENQTKFNRNNLHFNWRKFEIFFKFP